MYVSVILIFLIGCIVSFSGNSVLQQFPRVIIRTAVQLLTQASAVIDDEAECKNERGDDKRKLSYLNLRLINL